MLPLLPAVQQPALKDWVKPQYRQLDGRQSCFDQKERPCLPIVAAQVHGALRQRGQTLSLRENGRPCLKIRRSAEQCASTHVQEANFLMWFLEQTRRGQIRCRAHMYMRTPAWSLLFRRPRYLYAP